MNIEALRRKSDFLNTDGPAWVRTVWTRPESFAHFLKTHRDFLAAKGAIAKVGREWFIESEKFPTVARRILGLLEEQS